MVETILYGSALSLVLALAGWFVPGRFWAARQFVTVPEKLAGATPDRPASTATFSVAVLVVTMPLWCSLLGFGVTLASDLGSLPPLLEQPIVDGDIHPALKIAHSKPVDWLRFVGDSTIALLLATGLAFWLLGGRQGFDRKQLAAIAERALGDVGSMIFLFGAAGGFKEVIAATGAGDIIARLVTQLPVSPVMTAFLVATLVRLALGSATASILTASALMAGVAQSLPGQETMLVLAIAVGVTVSTQPADSGFWLVKEYGNLDVRDVLFKFNGCRVFMACIGVAIVLIAERFG